MASMGSPTVQRWVHSAVQGPQLSPGCAQGHREGPFSPNKLREAVCTQVVQRSCGPELMGLLASQHEPRSAGALCSPCLPPCSP